jgi:3(or 17)beta-hydroxysteroid dehydrogenase
MNTHQNGRVAGKTAIVTGAAAGIGEAIARLLVSEGATVFITDVDVERGEAVAADIGAHFCRHDVTREEDWARVMAVVAAEAGQLQILVNNAGIGHLNGPGTPEHTSLDDWREMMRVNCDSVFLGCRYGIEAMKAGGGSIVNMSSIAALVPVPQLAPYGVSKAGVAHYTRSVALYCLQSGYRIRCNSVHPGQMQTAMLDGLFSKMSAQTGIDAAELRKSFLTRVPMGEFGTADDVAHAVLYFASDESRYATGTRLVVDGGIELMNGS